MVTRRARPRHRAGWPAGALAAVVLVAGCTSGGGGPAARRTTTSTTVPATTTTTTDPGLLPQTTALPSPASLQFQSEMAALWQGVVDASVTEATPAFFPESAYLQVKTVADPAADFRERLLAEYGLDVAAAHALVSTGQGEPALVEVLVPTQYAHWVPPGTCSNRVGYYEVANSRVVYRLGTTERSFGIASLISWRGEWYVVHLGAVVRSGSGGMVDDPEAGTGSSAPSTSC